MDQPHLSRSEACTVRSEGSRRVTGWDGIRARERVIEDEHDEGMEW